MMALLMIDDNNVENYNSYTSIFRFLEGDMIYATFTEYNLLITFI